jgi:glycosyltransferase involved in cell wall biosynthesis
MTAEPFVSVVTPVYNGETFLDDCIESVLAQDYRNWEYVIVNNRSTDRTLELAEQYAKRDRRIRVVTNQAFVGCIENHNIALRQISPESEYCKVVCADDRLLPQCLRKMVQVAARNPTVGIVGSYQQSDDIIKWKGLPKNVSVLPGCEVCRLSLLREVHVFGNPTSVLYRSDLVRKAIAGFFPHSAPHADTSACYAYLYHCDFGFVHEVLSGERVHAGQLTKEVEVLNGGNLAHLETLATYGPLYLSETELAMRKHELLATYYRMLGGCVLKMKPGAFWEFHRQGLSRIGLSLDQPRVLVEAIREVVRELRMPLTALRKLTSMLAERAHPGTMEWITKVRESSAFSSVSRARANQHDSN